MRYIRDDQFYLLRFCPKEGVVLYSTTYEHELVAKGALDHSLEIWPDCTFVILSGALLNLGGNYPPSEISWRGSDLVETRNIRDRPSDDNVEG